MYCCLWWAQGISQCLIITEPRKKENRPTPLEFLSFLDPSVVQSRISVRLPSRAVTASLCNADDPQSRPLYHGGLLFAALSAEGPARLTLALTWQIPQTSHVSSVPIRNFTILPEKQRQHNILCWFRSTEGTFEPRRVVGHLYKACKKIKKGK